MRLVVQRVKWAKCEIDGVLSGKCDNGYMVLVGVGLDDNKDIIKKMADKLSKLRVFEDEEGKMNLDIFAINGSILSISQFTLYANNKKGNRPSFTNARKGEEAKELYEYFNDCLRENGLIVETGVFGADMQVSLLNDGPVTIILDSGEIIK